MFPKSKILTWLFYGLIGAIASLGLFLIFYWSLSLNSSIYTFINNTKSQPAYLWTYAALTLGTIILFGINLPLFIYRWRKYGFPELKVQSGTGLGAVIGIAASSCPLCGSVLLAAIGITGGLAAFPFAGLELKSLSFGLMALPIFLTGKELKRFSLGVKDCPAPRDASYQSKDRPSLIFLAILFLLLIIKTWSMVKLDPLIYGNI